AVLLAKLDSFKEELARRDAIACQYDAGLAGHVQVPVRVADSVSAWAIYAVLLANTAERDALQARLKDRG
ncbi:DegT/DnrJ/EryC1/StrS family aminotransferase, partial [Gluconobacter kondonii]|uniref:DegT/DnrJ/EryC1/StrS family aminotransferase n=1 Tax=Gluconobacter kondonii TaxID=941463 RepID=UPI00222F3E17